jgi:hypothetical protein
MTSLESRGLAVAIAALLLACSGSEEPAHTDAPMSTSDASTAPADPTRPRQSQGAVELPEDFPSDVPIYSPSTFDKVLVGEGRHAASFTTEASSQEVASFYREQLRGNGWDLEEAIEFGDQVMLSGAKQGRTISVFIMSRKELTAVAVSVSSG